jgi:3-oxoadipate enol-lactonase
LIEENDTLGVMMRTVRIADGSEVGYAEGGDPTARDVLVLLHGGGLDHRMWAPQLDAFPGWRTLAPDARSHGWSSTAAAPYGLADDVAALLDALGVDRVVIAGVSMGGGTAVDLTVTHPERVRAVVVSGTGTSQPDFRDPWVLETFAMWQRSFETQDPELWIRGFERFVPGPHRTLDEVDPAVVRACDEMVRHTLTSHVLPVVARGGLLVSPTPVADVNERRAAIAVPVLAVVGGGDAEDHQRLAHELVDLVDDGTAVVVERVGHYPNLEEPARFDAALAGLLDRVG